MKKAVVLLSGGLDSTVTLAFAIYKGYKVYPLHINYNQLTMQREFEAFNNICDHYAIDDRLVVDISYLSDIGGSSLTDDRIKVEEGVIPKKSGILPSTYVPFRNGNMLAIAVSYAERINANKIFIGAVDEDSSGYPDCTKIFFKRYNALLKIGLAKQSKIKILTPVIDMRKSDVVKLGAKLNAPLELSWSCYQSSDEACGVCESCYLRLKGFRKAGIDDKIKYKKIIGE